MNRGRIGVLVVALSVLASGCGVESSADIDGTSLPSIAAPVGLGEAVYAASCAACHGDRGEGVPGVGSSLTSGEFVESTDEAMREVITDGQDATDPSNTMGVAMPAKGGNPRLTAEEIEAVLGYVRDLQP